MKKQPSPAEDKIRQLEKELRKCQDQLVQSQKMEALGTLVAGVAHEINNPINLIMYNTRLLKKIWKDFLPLLQQRAGRYPQEKYGGLRLDFLEENMPQMITDVDLAANRVAKTVTDLKNFARQTNIAEKIPVQLNDAVKNALRLVQTSLRNSGVTMDCRTEENLPLMEGNLQSIEQILINIVINAVQAIDHDAGRIEIRTGVHPTDGRLFVTIADNGKGIDPAVSDKLFVPFVTDKHDQGGTGLGLSVSYNLLKAHRGDIEYESRQGAGSTFRLYFPAMAGDEKPKILLVDDDPAIRRLLTRALTSQSAYAVDEAHNGTEACIKLGIYRPALLILDVFMPDMDGVEVCRAIVRDPQLADVKVLITTGYPGHTKLKEVKDLGFDDIVSKPFKLPDLLGRIDKILTI
jgi:signal transduction histidine kinase